MAVGARAVADIADLIDAIIEVRDARLPRTTAVASLHAKLRRKPVFVLLNRADLADQYATKSWMRYFSAHRIPAFEGIGTNASSLRSLRAAISSAPRRHGRFRLAVVGAPNTGKSSVINALARQKRAATQNRPGVTKRAGWLKVGERVDVLDTPGLLPPKIADPQAAWQLALCGSLAAAAFDPEEVARRFADWLADRDPALAGSLQVEKFAAAHGMLRKGGELDGSGAARKIVSMFRAGAFGRFTFELPELDAQR